VPRSFAPAIPLGALALAVAVAAGVGIAAAPSSDDTQDAALVVRHHDHDRVKLRHEIRKQLRENVKQHGFEGRGPRGDGPPGLLRGGFDARGFGARGFGAKDLERSPAFALLPDSLQRDLREVAVADPDDRRALIETIRDKALAGGYGSKVEEAFRLLQERRRR
jgi:hypothetical protein